MIHRAQARFVHVCEHRVKQERGRSFWTGSRRLFAAGSGSKGAIRSSPIRTSTNRVPTRLRGGFRLPMAGGEVPK
jgi:hypothetical protein